MQGVSGTDTATGSQSPDDGDFLGPWVFPWASKILFSVSQIKIYFSTDKSTSPLKANSRKSEPVQKIKQWCRKVKL